MITVIASFFCFPLGTESLKKTVCFGVQLMQRKSSSDVKKALKLILFFVFLVSNDQTI